MTDQVGALKISDSRKKVQGFNRAGAAFELGRTGSSIHTESALMLRLIAAHRDASQSKSFFWDSNHPDFSMRFLLNALRDVNLLGLDMTEEMAEMCGEDQAKCANAIRYGQNWGRPSKSGNENIARDRSIVAEEIISRLARMRTATGLAQYVDGIERAPVMLQMHLTPQAVDRIANHDATMREIAKNGLPISEEFSKKQESRGNLIAALNSIDDRLASVNQSLKMLPAMEAELKRLPAIETEIRATKAVIAEILNGYEETIDLIAKRLGAIDARLPEKNPPPPAWWVDGCAAIERRQAVTNDYAQEALKVAAESRRQLSPKRLVGLALAIAIVAGATMGGTMLAAEHYWRPSTAPAITADG